MAIQEREEVMYIQDIVLAATLKYFGCEYIWVELKSISKEIYEFKFIRNPELDSLVDSLTYSSEFTRHSRIHFTYKCEDNEKPV